MGTLRAVPRRESARGAGVLSEADRSLMCPEKVRRGGITPVLLQGGQCHTPGAGQDYSDTSTHHAGGGPAPEQLQDGT